MLRDVDDQEYALRDRKAYELARVNLLGLPGVTETVLQHYLSGPPPPTTMAGVFHRLLVSLRNRNMMATFGARQNWTTSALES